MSLTVGADGFWRTAKKNDKIWLYAVEKSKSGQARCRRCSDLIKKAELRFAIPIRDPRGQHGYIPAWQHVKCTRVDPLEEGMPGTLADYIVGLADLSKQEQGEVMAEVSSSEKPTHLQELNPDDLVKRPPCEPMEPPPAILQHLLKFQKEGLAWMVQQELSEYKGGILADEMGMGKTIQSVCLIVANRGVGPTLVVCPVSSMMQWQEEINFHVAQGELKVVIFSKTKKVSKEELETADVVLTSYPILELSWRNVLNAEKLPCKYCGQMFLPRKLQIHNKYFCGPNAQKTEKQSKQESNSRKRQSKSTIKKGLRTLHVEVDGEGDEMPDEVDLKEETNGKKKGKGAKEKKSAKPAKPAKKVTGSGKAKQGKGSKPARKKQRTESSSDESSSAEDEEESDEASEDAKEKKAPSPTGKKSAAPSAKRGIAGPMGMYRELMEEAGRKARSRWERKRNAESSSESSSSSDDDDSDDSDESDEEESDSEEEEETETKAIRTVAKKSFAANGGGDACVGTGEVNDQETRELRAKVICPACDFPLRKFHFCPRTGQQHIWEKIPGLDQDEEADYGGDVVDINRSILHTVKWFRVILDEAHRIKSRSTGTTKAAFALKAERKWCLTGTPLQNRVGDLYSLLRFLRMSPFARYYCGATDCSCSCLSHPFSGRLQLRACIFCGHGPLAHYSYFNKHIMNPIMRYGYVGDGRKALMLLCANVLNKIMLRRTKAERAADMELPSCSVEVKMIQQTPEELDFYSSLYKRSTAGFDTFVKKGTVLHNYAHIFQLLSRLRQALDHPYLVAFKQDEQGGALVSTENLPALSVNQSDVCAICMEDIAHARDLFELQPCRHKFHRLCICQFIDSEPTDQHSCPKCYNSVTFDARLLHRNDDDEEDIVAVAEEDADEIGPAEPEGGPAAATDDNEDGITWNAAPEGAAESKSKGAGSPGRKSGSKSSAASPIRKSSILNKVDTAKFVTSTKLEAIVAHVKSVPEDEKVIIFSQFGTMLDLIEFRLERSEIKTVKLTGSMQLSVRQSSLKAFRSDPKVKVILISLKAGGEGLNLQVANHVILTDPWWNPAVEMQAVQRAHRIGQTRVVKAVRFVTANTIEERMLQLQDKKMLVFEGTIDGKVSSLHRLSEEDLAFLFGA